MINVFKEYEQAEKILILGFGREGRSTYDYLRAIYPDKTLYIMDQKEIDGSNLEHVVIVPVSEYMMYLDQYDVVINSPGIVLGEHRKEIQVLETQVNLFLKYFSRQVIGITGTKGKSTTSSLIYHVLKSYDDNTFLVGNIGIPCFRILDQINESSKIVVELSCHQLEYAKYSPHIGILLNFYEEHLDHYGTYENYKNAKRHIYMYQNEKDYLFINEEIDFDTKARVETFAFNNRNAMYSIEGRNIVCKDEVITIGENDTKLLGNHNVYNIAISKRVCAIMGISDEMFMAVLPSFQPLAHRQEFVGVYHGIHFYDDSISTANETAISALKSIPNVQTLLLGGMDRGIDYQPLIDYLSNNYSGNVICMYASGKRMYISMQEKSMNNIYYCSDLKQSVELAKAITMPGKSCVLSPASASYGYFRDFEERGDYFKMYCKE